MTAPLERPGGHFLWTANHRVDAADLNNMGKVAEQSLWNGFVARLLHDFTGGDPQSGFVGDDCAVSVVSGLDLEVGPGFGLLWSDDLTDEFGCDVRPIQVDAAAPLTLDAHDASPRIDKVCIRPATVDDVSSGRQVWNGTTFDPDTQMTRRRRAYALLVVKGTPAGSPVAPATPSGHLALAEVTVPATSGAVSVQDVRPKLGIQGAWLGDGQVGTAQLATQAVTNAKLGAFAVTADKIGEGEVGASRLAARLVYLHPASIGAESSNQRLITFQLRDFSGTAVNRNQRVLARVYDKDGEHDENAFAVQLSLGSAETESGSRGRLVAKTSGPDFALYVQDLTSSYVGNLFLEVVPVADEGGDVFLGMPTVLKLAFTT